MDRFKGVLEKIKAFWGKFNNKQRVLFISVLSAVVIAIVIIAVVSSRTNSVILRECVSATEATEVRTLLADNDISCTVDNDYVIRVDEADYTEAKLILGSNNISSYGYTLQDAVNGSLTTTAADAQKKYVAYLESKFSHDLEDIDGIKAANVTISFPESDNTIFSENEDASITAMLTLTHELSYEQCEAIGLLLATNVGSKNSNNVTVLDNGAHLLYYGGTSTVGGTYTAAQKVQQQLENSIIAKAKSLILQGGYYTDIAISPNLDVSFDNVEIVEKEYSIPEGSEEGLYKHSYEVDSSGSLTDASGVAGTESNDQDTTYEIQNGDGSVSEYSLREYDWLQNEKITTTKEASGKVNYDGSSISMVATKTNVLTEDSARAQGLLDEMSWEEFKFANSDPTALDVDDGLYGLVATGTGIPRDNITIMAYEQYMFYEEEKEGTSPFFILQIILAVLIAGLLIFIIIRSTRPVAVEETEPELSVEDMLATTKEQRTPLEEIDLQDKSETRLAIEKFVDENPESVALLLRNWLNDGWE